ncbi:AAA family ATPase [Lentibacillus kapialis]|nr:AAA family ATPase [Lentibacillus kapialis]
MGPLIVEFNGLSGCGKTTNAKALTSKLQEAGFSVATASSLIDFYHGKRLPKLRLLLPNMQLNLSLFQYMMSLKPFSFYRLRCLSAVWTFTYIYKKSAQHQNQILIIDQGIIQALSAAVYLNTFQEDRQIRRVLTQLNRQNFNLLVVNCLSNGSQAADRIQIRNEQKNRFDRMARPVLDNNLNTHGETFESVRRHVTDIMNGHECNLDMSLPVEQNTMDLFNVIYHYQPTTAIC